MAPWHRVEIEILEVLEGHLVNQATRRPRG
jgi:hypothetical protein